MKIETNDPLATVLIVNYNNSNCIDQCLKSVINQNYKKIEIIVVDDNSSDNSLEILNRYTDQIKLIKKKKKTGLGFFDQMSSYYEGFKESKGEIIFFLDSDDYFHLDKVSIVMNEFYQNEKINILFDLPIKKYFNKEILFKNKKKLFNNYWPYIPPTSCISVRKNDFEYIFKLVNYKLFPDVWLDFRIGIVSKYIFSQFNLINKNLTFYRQSTTSVSSNFVYLSQNWWKRRKQAHNYIQYFFTNNKIKYKKNLDYFLTNFINYFI